MQTTFASRVDHFPQNEISVTTSTATPTELTSISLADPADATALSVTNDYILITGLDTSAAAKGATLADGEVIGQILNINIAIADNTNNYVFTIANGFADTITLPAGSAVDGTITLLWDGENWQLLTTSYQDGEIALA